MPRAEVNDLRIALALARIVGGLRRMPMPAGTIKPVIYGGILARLLGVPSLANAVTGLGQVFTVEKSMPRPSAGARAGIVQARAALGTQPYPLPSGHYVQPCEGGYGANLAPAC